MNDYSSSSLPFTDRVLVIASFNKDKVREISNAFRTLPLTLRFLGEFPEVSEAPETGSSFSENAQQKAEFYANLLHPHAVLAEDSGLVIPALNGYPGIHSARIAQNDRSRIDTVLDRLKAARNPSRFAYYVCSMCLVAGANRRIVEARCEGSITKNPAGTSGFGYDPIFVPTGSDKTFGQMTIEEKANYSHRARAAEKILPYILKDLT